MRRIIRCIFENLNYSEEKFKIWFEIEAHACDALAELGVIPKKSAETIWKKGNFDIKKIDEIEKTTKHDEKQSK